MLDVDYPSASRLKRIGRALEAGAPSPEDVRDFQLHLQRCDDVLARAQEALQHPAFLADAPPGYAVQGRLKTLLTLLEKLHRMGGARLADIRDIVGLRIVADLTTDEQVPLAHRAMSHLGVPTDGYRLIDRRLNPSPGGYRALHVEFRLDGVRAELQIRTRRQHIWAEAYERLGDAIGRQIRYPTEQDELNESAQGIVMAMEKFSNTVYLADVGMATLVRIEGLARRGVLTEQELGVLAESREALQRTDEAVDTVLEQVTVVAELASQMAQEQRDQALEGQL